jgi:hypothetical protein
MVAEPWFPMPPVEKKTTPVQAMATLAGIIVGVS